MRVFLSGATGYIGSAVAQTLLRGGHRVSGLARSEEKARLLESRGIMPHPGDLTDGESLARGTRECEAVIHLASTNNAEAPAADKIAVESILKGLENSTKPFIYTSGVWVMGNTGAGMADEKSPLSPVPFVAWRAEMEKIVLEKAKQGIHSIVIRPALVYGHAGGLTRMMVQSALERGAARYVGSGENFWTFVHVEALAELYAQALGSAPAGSLFIGAQADPVRVRDVAEAASTGAGAHGKTESWPLEDARKLLGPIADALVLDQRVSGKKAEEAFGWKPKFPTVLETLAHGSTFVRKISY